MPRPNSIKLALLFLPLLSSLSLLGCDDKDKLASVEKKNTTASTAIETTPTNAKLTAAWSDLVNEYQKRMLLVPELLAVVREPYDKEQAAFAHFREARAKIGSLHASSEQLNDPQKMNAYQSAQANLDNAMYQLLEVARQYPELTSDVMYQELIEQLQREENMIAMAQNRYAQNQYAQNQYAQNNGSYDTVLNRYERRQDLATNLPKLIQPYTFDGTDVFSKVDAAKNNIDAIDMTTDNIAAEMARDPQAVAKYLAAQEKMDTALSNLMMVSEHYTELKSNAEYLRLQSALEAIHNRLMIARNTFNEELK